jgi:hypothetical protein
MPAAKSHCSPGQLTWPEGSLLLEQARQLHSNVFCACISAPKQPRSPTAGELEASTEAETTDMAAFDGVFD